MDPTTVRRLLDWLAWGVLAVLVAADIASARVIISGAYPTAAVVASTMMSVRRTAAVAAVSVALAGASFLWNDHRGPVDFGLRLVIGAVLAAVAVLSAQVRVRRERDLADMTVIAETVQQAVLRSIPRQVGDVGLATEYQSATRAALVGGDLFEVADTAHGVRVIVGDVRGKGMEAVQLAATVLAAFRRAAFSQSELTGVATEIDKVVKAVAGDEDFVTAVLCQFHPGGMVTVVNRGHHPPLLLTPGQEAPRFVETGDPQPPLGLGADSRAVELTWTAKARLLLYTDGLVEARNSRRSFFPLEDWAADLAAEPLDEALGRLLAEVRRFTGNESTDDIALLLAENREVASSTAADSRRQPTAAQPG